MKGRIFMKLFKKLAAGLLAGAMAFAMTATAMAATGGTITVKDTVNAATYTLYKVFDATTGADGAISYTIPAGSDIATKEGFDTYFETRQNGAVTYVWKKTGVTDTNLFGWLKDNVTKVQIEEKTSGGNQQDVKFENLAYGYYFVKSSVNQGAAVMVTSVAPTAVVHEKNAKPGWGANGKKTVAEADGSDRTDKTYNIGDTIHYKLSYTSALNYDNGEKVYQYVVKDTLPTGVELNLNSFTVKVGNQTLNKADTGAANTYKLDNQATGSFQITIPWALTRDEKEDKKDNVKDDFFYAAPEAITVTYTATLKNTAAEGSTASNENTAEIAPNTKTDNDPHKEKVYYGSITINKTDDANPAKPLAGAKFVLANGDGKYLKEGTNGEKTWVQKADLTDLSDITVFTTAETTGQVKITGLAAGTYTLTEVEAPQGYNLLKDPTTVELKLKGQDGVDDTLVKTETIKNQKGTQLPSTGGAGTTMIYIIGAALALLASVVLIARKRMSDSEI